ncbi:MAG: FkbM family methyltransferase [Pseudohongiella sp.]|nr:FkbM family methyltransferase [Pseudohongiella sp.]
MQPDTASAFGHYRPDSRVTTMISLSQNAPANFIGRQFAKLMRNAVRARAKPPLDIEVDGLKLRCYLWDNYTERKLVFMPWRFDVQERRKILSVLPVDGVFVDIGANIGVYALFAATHMNSCGRVVALEPYPPVHDRLCFNMQATRNGRTAWPEVTVLPIGVADTDMEFELRLNPDNLGENSIIADSGSGSGDTILVHCKPLLDILSELSINHIDVLKIDIEGAEDIALCPFFANAPDSLLPGHLLIENSEKRWKQDLGAAIMARGYEVALQTRMNTIYRQSYPA